MPLFTRSICLPILLLICTLLPLISIGQSAQRIYYSPDFQEGLAVKIGPNGPVGLTRGTPTMGMVNLQANGTIINWQGDEGEFTRFSYFTSDNGFITTRGNGEDIIVEKYDSTGTQTWSQVVGSSSIDEGPAGLVEGLNGDYYLGVYRTGSTLLGGVYKLNSSGQVQWMANQTTLTLSGRLQAEPSGGCSTVYKESVFSPSFTSYDRIIKLNSSGTEILNKQGMQTIGGVGYSMKTQDGGYVLLEYANAALPLEIRKYDVNFDSIWKVQYDFNALTNNTHIGSYVFSAITETQDEDILFSGVFTDSITDVDYACMGKVDKNGILLWMQIYDEDIYPADLVEGPNQEIYLIGGAKRAIIPPGNKQHLWFLHTDSVGYYNTSSLRGTLFHNLNVACEFDPGETTLPSWPVKATSTWFEIYAASNNQGEYDLASQVGSYQVELFAPSPLWDPCNSPMSYQVTSSTQIDSMDFGIEQLALCPWLDLSVASFGQIRPGDTIQIDVKVCNNGTVAADNPNLELTLPPDLTYVSGPVGMAQSGQVLTLSMDTLPVVACVNYPIDVTVDTLLSLGTYLKVRGKVTPDSICLPSYTGPLPTRDSTTVEVVASYDPNRKTGMPVGFGPEHNIPYQTQELSYTLEFQNTGSAPAFEVVLRDELPPELDPTTLRPGGSSHPYTYNLVEDGVAIFRFDPINLLDSATNEPESRGFVKFKINTVPNLPIGTKIHNYVDIFFDFNLPVRTETWTYTLADIPLSVAESSRESAAIAVYPNPMTNTLTVDGTTLTEHADFQLFNLSGQLVLQSRLMKGSSPSISVESVPAGYYIYSITNAGQRLATGKLVKISE